MWESHTILRYLVAKYGNEQWSPACPFQRSLAERWSDWSQTMFQPAFMQTFWGFYRKPETQRNMKAVNTARSICETCLEIINQQLSQSRYLTGNQLSLADIAVGAVLYRLTSQGLSIELPPHVARWYQGLQSRAGYRQWIMSDFSELKGREDY